MNNLLKIMWPLMAEAGGEGGGGESGATKSAAAEHAEVAKEEKPAEEPKSEGGGEAGEPKSAAAAHAEVAKEEKPEDVDLVKMTDDDWVKAVMPDPEDENAPKPDRKILTPMAKALREAGVQPHVMQKIVKAYESSVDGYVKDRNEARKAHMAELNQRCEKEITADEWRDFGAAYKEHIAKDKELSDIFNHTELGSNPTLIKLIALAGATIRVDTPPPAAATAGSSQEDLDRRLFERTVPQHLR